MLVRSGLMPAQPGVHQMGQHIEGRVEIPIDAEDAQQEEHRRSMRIPFSWVSNDRTWIDFDGGYLEAIT